MHLDALQYTRDYNIWKQLVILCMICSRHYMNIFYLEFKRIFPSISVFEYPEKYAKKKASAFIIALHEENGIFITDKTTNWFTRYDPIELTTTLFCYRRSLILNNPAFIHAHLPRTYFISDNRWYFPDMQAFWCSTFFA